MDLGCGFAIDDDVALAIESAVQQLRRAGWKIDISHPAWPPKTNEYPLLAQQQAGLAALFGQAYQEAPQIFDRDIAVQIEAGQKATGPMIAGLSLQRNKLREALNTYFNSYDLLLCPTVPVEPFLQFGLEVQKVLNLNMNSPMVLAQTEQDYAQAS